MEVPMSYTILRVDSSPVGEHSVSRKLTEKILAELKAKYPDTRLIERDLGRHPLPHLDALTIGAFFTPPEKRNDALTNAIKTSDQAVDELIAADAVIIGAPMHNFGIPSSLKSWIDHVVRAGRTFQYGESGPKGLLSSSKRVFVVLSRGGVYSEGPMKAFDYQESYLKTIFGFIGLNNVEFVRAEGIAMGPDAATAAINAAEMQVSAVVKRAA